MKTKVKVKGCRTLWFAEDWYRDLRFLFDYDFWRNRLSFGGFWSYTRIKTGRFGGGKIIRQCRYHALMDIQIDYLCTKS